MKTILRKHWALLGFILTFLLDQQTGFIAQIVTDAYWQNFIKGLGSLLLAYFWKNQNHFLNRKRQPKPRGKLLKKEM